jgi:hypothetical protein
MPDIMIGASNMGLSGFIMHGWCRGLDGLYVFQPSSVHAIGGWCVNTLFDMTDKNCKYLQAANVLAQVDVAWDE